jgi:hypothetical protein
MGVLKNLGLVIVSVVLFLSLLSAGIFATLNYSLTYENIQPKIYPIAESIVKEQIGSEKIVNQLTPFLEVYCKNNTEIIQNFDGYTFVFPCTVVEKGYNSIINYSTNYLIQDFYYKDYNCSFVECFQETDVPLFLVSEHAKNYWESLLKKSLLAILILIGLTILFVERKSNAPILTGSLLIASSLIISQLKNIGTWIAKLILSPISVTLSNENSREITSRIVEMFFAESAKIFLWMFISGIILIGIGLILKLTTLGIKIKNWIEKIKTKNKIENLEENQKEIQKKINNSNTTKSTKKPNKEK